MKLNLGTSGRVSALIAVAVVLIMIAVPFAMTSSDDSSSGIGQKVSDGEFIIPVSPRDSLSGEIEIWTVEDLAKIGKDSGYPVNGNFIQMATIDFTDSDDPIMSAHLSTMGSKMRVTPYVEGFDPSDSVVFTLEYFDENANNWIPIVLTSLRYSFGLQQDIMSVSTDANGAISILNSDSGYDGSRSLIFMVADYTTTPYEAYGENFIYSIEVKKGSVGAQDPREAYQRGNFAMIENFTGTYNGNGYEITGMDIAKNYDGVALFGGGEIKNLGRKGGSTTGIGSSNVAGIVSKNNAATEYKVYNCYNTGHVVGSNYVSGIVSDVENKIHLISYCYNTGTIAGYNFVGGITNQTYPVSNIAPSPIPIEHGIIGCYNSGSISAVEYAGGITSELRLGEVTDCYNTGDVWAGNNAGGIVGVLRDGSVTECYNTGSVSVDTDKGSHAAGIAGRTYGGSISDCYNRGAIEGKTNIAGIAGEASGAISNTYNTGTVNGTVGTIKNGTGGAVTYSYYLSDRVYGEQERTSAWLKDQANYPMSPDGWDFVNTWTFANAVALNDGYPILASSLTLFITEQPADAYIDSRSNAVFNVSAKSLYGPINYKWEISTDNGTTWSSEIRYGLGANTDCLVLSPSDYPSGTKVRCVVSNNSTSITTLERMLCVNMDANTHYVSSVEDLMRIGVEEGWELDHNYIQTNDINFKTSAAQYFLDTQGRGQMIQVTPEVMANGDVKFTIKTKADSSAGTWTSWSNKTFTYLFGDMTVGTGTTDGSGVFTSIYADSNYDITSGAPTVFAFGSFDEQVVFAIEVSGGVGTKSPKESYSKGDMNPIGIFTGEYDGKGYAIIGLDLISFAGDLGLFKGIADGGTVKNLGLEGGSTTSFVDGYVGSIAGSVSCDGSGGNGHVCVDNCYNTGIVSKI